MKLFGKIVIILVVLTVAGYYLWAKTTYLDFVKPRVFKLCCIKDETANWKTYNSKMGFDIKYPSDWVVIVTSPQDESFIAFDKSTQIDGKEVCVDMGCKLPGVIIAKGTTSISEYISGLDRYDRKVIEREDVNIASKRYVRLLTYSVPNQNNEYEFLYQKNESLFSFSSIYGNDKEYVRILEKMLSTFKFTK